MALHDRVPRIPVDEGAAYFVDTEEAGGAYIIVNIDDASRIPLS